MWGIVPTRRRDGERGPSLDPRRIHAAEGQLSSVAVADVRLVQGGDHSHRPAFLGSSGRFIRQDAARRERLGGFGVGFRANRSGKIQLAGSFREGRRCPSCSGACAPGASEAWGLPKSPERSARTGEPAKRRGGGGRRALEDGGARHSTPHPSPRISQSGYNLQYFDSPWRRGGGSTARGGRPNIQQGASPRCAGAVAFAVVEKGDGRASPKLGEIHIVEGEFLTILFDGIRPVCGWAASLRPVFLGQPSHALGAFRPHRMAWGWAERSAPRGFTEVFLRSMSDVPKGTKNSNFHYQCPAREGSHPCVLFLVELQSSRAAFWF